MIYWQNRILTNVKTALGNKCSNVVATMNSKNAKFPTCQVKVVSNNSVADDLGCGDEENAVYCGVSVDIETKTSLADAMALLSVANTAMYQMGFKRRQGPVEAPRTENPDIYHVTARYARIIGAGDVIEKFE